MHVPQLSASALCALCVVAMAQPAQAGQFDYTDTSTAGTWTAPTGVDAVQVILSGAAGGAGASISGGSGGSGGGGAIVASSINVSAGTTLDIDLGHEGTNANGGTGASAGGASGFTGGGGDGGSDFGGAGGGGGGGASVVRIGGANVLIAGGGGGGGGANGDLVGGATLVANPTGGSGGSAGTGYVVLNGSSTFAVSPGTAGSNSSTAGGGAGTGSAGGAAGDVLNATAGVSNQGGVGGRNFCAGGGGGGGYFGGGGGGGAQVFASSGCSGGGAGSSYMNPTWTGTNRIYTDGANSGAGEAQINYIDFTTTSLTNGEVGSNYSQNVIATFGAATSPDVWSVSPPLPAGLTLNASTGAITGTPTEAVNTTYTVTASYNPGGLGLIARSSTSLTLLIAAAPEPEPEAAVRAVNSLYVVAPNISSRGGPWNVRVGDPTILIPTVNSGSAARYSISPALPQGLSLNEFTGVISGVAQSVSPQLTYTLTATNPGGSSAASFAMGVVGELSSAANNSSGPSEPAANAVRFSAGTYSLNRAARASLDRMINGQGKRAFDPLVITAVIPRSASSSAQQAAYRRGVTVRKYLRSRGLDVASQIQLREAADPKELRQVAIN